LFGISYASVYDVYKKGSSYAPKESDVSNSLFGALGFALLFLVLPLITKLKLGVVEVEMESKGKRPLCNVSILSLMSA
jgi:hypothetical protein